MQRTAGLTQSAHTPDGAGAAENYPDVTRRANHHAQRLPSLRPCGAAANEPLSIGELHCRVAAYVAVSRWSKAGWARPGATGTAWWRLPGYVGRYALCGNGIPISLDTHRLVAASSEQ